MRGWRQVNGREVRNEATHPLAALRYFAHERHVVEKALKRAGGRQDRPVAADDEERRPSEREAELDRGVRVVRHGSPRRDLAGVAGAEDSPLRAASDRIDGLDLRERER